jgi:hypothetical protein
LPPYPGAIKFIHVRLAPELSKEVRLVKIMIPAFGTAIEPRPRFGLAACLPGFPPALSACPSAVIARPSTEKPALIAERRQSALLHVGGAVAQLNGQVPTYMTRISAASAFIGAMGAGAQGSHPAREPEPV